MNNRTHFQHHGSVFTQLECQYACALHLYVRTRRYYGGGIVDHSQPPTQEMLEEMLRLIRYDIWDAARRSGTHCNEIHPNAYLNAYCLVRSLRHNPFYRRWYEDVCDRPDLWRHRAYQIFHNWVSTGSEVVRRYVLPISYRLVH